ncbi:MAG: AMP-binding protein [Novosphingobium sp.]
MQAEIATIEDIVRQHARNRPDAPIATYGGKSLTYREMDRRSNQIANTLIRSGIGADHRIGIVAKNCLGLFETLFAARKIGAVQVAVNWRLAPAEMAYILSDAGVRLLFAEDAFLAGLQGQADTLPPDMMIVSLDSAGPNVPGLEEWIADADDSDPGFASGPHDVALQLYTSGTTGRPKGAMLMNRSIFAFIEAAARIFGRDPDARHLNCLPLFHVGGINWALQAMAQGAHCIGFRDFDAKQVIRTLGEGGITHLMAVPAILQMLLEVEDVRHGEFGALRAIVYGGSTISERVLKDATTTFGCGMYGMYGATELSFGNTLLLPEEHDFDTYPELATSCGRAFEGSTIKIVDPVSLAEMPEGEPGEVWMQSPQRAKGYWNQASATAENFLADGWYRTGDIGTLRNAYLHLSDRLNDMIVSGSENIYPAEVERVLLSNTDIVEACVFSVPDDKWGEAVTAVVRLAPKADFDEVGIIAFCRERLAHFKCPKSIRVVDALPRTASGKIQRHMLRAPYWEGKKRKIN